MPNCRGELLSQVPLADADATLLMIARAPYPRKMLLRLARHVSGASRSQIRRTTGASRQDPAPGRLFTESSDEVLVGPRVERSKGFSGVLERSCRLARRPRSRCRTPRLRLRLRVRVRRLARHLHVTGCQTQANSPLPATDDGDLECFHRALADGSGAAGATDPKPNEEPS